VLGGSAAVGARFGALEQVTDLSGVVARSAQVLTGTACCLASGDRALLRQRPGASAVTGYIAVWGILKLVRNRSFAPFVLYRLVVGLAVLGLVATPIR
jgi:undecaprenyl pyrophosphate phosphatase UppP